MLFPSVNRQKSWLLFLLAVLVTLNIYFHFSFQGQIHERGRWVDRGFSVLLSPFQKALFNSKVYLGESADYLRRLSQADQENVLLRNELELAKLELQKLSELDAENQRLRDLLNFKAETKLQLMAAKIKSRDMSLFTRSVQVDRGSFDGIAPGMAVVSPLGAVGQVIRVEENSSVIQLLTDVNSRLDGVVERSRAQVIVGGSLQGELKLNLLSRRSEIRQGDLIFSAGTGDIFPAGFKIGTIVGHAQDPNSILEEAEVEPSVDFGELEEVFIVSKSFGVKK